MSAVLPPNLAVQQANDAVPGTVPRIPAPLQVLRANAAGNALEYVDASTAGVAGQNAFTTLAAGFTMPAIGSGANATVGSTAWLALGQPVFLATGGQLSVSAIVNSTTVSLTNTGATGNAAPGTVIASGSKLTPAGAQGANGAGGGFLAVKYVQTTTFPGTYSAGAWTATSAGTLDPSVFDGVTPSIGDLIEFNSLAVANVGNGRFVRVADTAGKFTAVRATDLNTSAAFASGVAYDVLAGSTLKGTRRQLYTAGTITLDTTPLLFDRTFARGFQEIDLSLPPWNLRDYPTAGAAASAYINGLCPEGGAALTQVAYQYFGQNCVFRLPSANGGYIPFFTPALLNWAIGFPNYTKICGGGKDRTTLAGQLGGGHLVDCTATRPADLGPAGVDTRTNNMSLALWNTTVNNPLTDVLFNLSDAGLRIGDNGVFLNGAQNLGKGWVNFEIRMMIRPHEFFTAADEHIISCSGRRLFSDALDTTFSVIQDSVNHRIKATLRTYDASAGVYGAVSHTGTGTSVVTGDGTTKPNWDTTWKIRVDVGGTIGTNDGKKISISFDGRRWRQIALGAATSITFGEPFAKLNGGQIVAKFNFGAGTLVANDLYSCTSSGCVQLNQLTTANNSLVADTTYCLILWYDGANFKIFLDQPGATGRTAKASVAQTGIVYQYAWEKVNLGRQYNYGQREGFTLLNSAHAYLGSIRILGDVSGSLPGTPSVVAPAGTTEASVLKARERGAVSEPTTGQRFFFCPTSNAVDPLNNRNANGCLTGPDGKISYYTGELMGDAQNFGLAWIKPRSTPSYSFASHLELRDFSIDAGIVRGSGLKCVGMTTCAFRDIGIRQGVDGFDFVGPGFFTEFENLDANVVDCGEAFIQGAFILLGEHKIDGGRIMAWFVGGVYSGNMQGRGVLFTNNEGGAGGTIVPLIIDGTEPGNLRWIHDDENQGPPHSGVYPDEHLRISVNPGSVFELSGIVGSGFLPTVPIAFGLDSNHQSGALILDKLQLKGHADTPAFIDVLDSVPAVKRPPVRVRPGGIEGLFANSATISLATVPNTVILERAGEVEGTPLGNADATLAAFDGDLHVLPASTLTANHNYTASADGTSFTFGPTTLLEGASKTFRRYDTSAFTAAIIDGASGATLYTMPASKMCEVKLRWTITAAFPRGQWQLAGVPVVT